MSALFDLKHLVDMMSIGTLLAYSIVAACVLVLRYSPSEERKYDLVPATSDSETDGNINNDSLLATTSTDVLAADEEVTFCSVVKQTFNLRMLRFPTRVSRKVVVVQIYVFVFASVFLWSCAIYLENEIIEAQAWTIVLLCTIGLVIILSLMSMGTQPNSQTVLNFKVPLVPLIPALSILINIYLMLMLDVHTWIRFGVWMLVGLPMYFMSVRYDSPLSIYTMHAKPNGAFHNTQKSNGQANINYVVDETDGENKKVTMEQSEELAMVVANNLNKSSNVKPKSPLPPIVSNNISSPMCSSLDSLSVSGALAALDEVLTKEELAIAQSFSYENPFNRKISIDTVSNASNIHFEESVIALIHNEDIHHEFERSLPILEEQTDVDSDTSSNKVTINEISPPPPPPPMDGFLTFKKKPIESRPSLTRSKSVPDLIFYSTNPSPPSRKSSVHSEQEDQNISIGSERYEKVALKLNQFLSKHSMGVPLKLTKPEVFDDREDVPKSPSNLPNLKWVLAEMPQPEQSDDGVIEEEAMKPADIKKKLNELLKSDPRSVLNLHKSNVKSDIKGEEMDTNNKDSPNIVSNDEANYKNIHKNLMGNTLRNLKLLKKNSFISNGIEGDK